MSKQHLGTKGIRHKFMLGIAAAVLCCAGGISLAWAQETSTTTVSHGAPSYVTTVQSGTVAYVSGNDLVLRYDDGRVEHFRVADSERFTVDGRDIGVQDLQPGTRLTQAITTKTTPRFVNTVTTINGTVWSVIPPNSLVLRFDDGNNKQYRIPDGQKFTINGKEETAFQLRKGMRISATVVTDEPQSVVEQTKSTLGQAPRPNTPVLVGALLIARRPATAAPVETANNAQPLPNKLPKTGSTVPLIGLLGLLSMGAALGLRVIRQRFV